MFIDTLIDEFGLHANSPECGKQSLSKVGIGGNNAWWDPVALTDDDAVGKFVMVIDRPAAGWPANKSNSELFTPLAYNLTFDTLKTTQRNRGLRPAKYT